MRYTLEAHSNICEVKALPGVMQALGYSTD